MKAANLFGVFFILVNFVSLTSAQNLVTFDDQGWSNDQVLSTNLVIGNYFYSSNESFYTNYGYNFDINGTSLYYVFQDAATDQITLATVNNAPVTVNSIAAYQVSETSPDTLIIEGWNNTTRLYSKSFSKITTWQTLALNYSNVNKIIIKISSSSGPQLTDYNFDNFSFSGVALPVELTTFNAAAVDNHIELKWQTATEISNYGFDVERNENNSGWVKIGFIKGMGNSNSPKSYSYTDNSISSGVKYKYRLKQLDNNGNFEYSKEVEISADIMPGSFMLSQNYPNPFNPTTIIQYAVGKPSDGKSSQLVTLKVYDILGKEVATLVNEEKPAGIYNVEFNIRQSTINNQLSSGIYLYQLRSGSYVETKKMLLMK